MDYYTTPFNPIACQIPKNAFMGEKILTDVWEQDSSKTTGLFYKFNDNTKNERFNPLINKIVGVIKSINPDYKIKTKIGNSVEKSSVEFNQTGENRSSEKKKMKEKYSLNSNSKSYSYSKTKTTIYQNNWTFISLNCSCCCSCGDLLSGGNNKRDGKSLAMLLAIGAAVFAVFYDIIGIGMNMTNLKNMKKLSKEVVTDVNQLSSASKNWCAEETALKKIPKFGQKMQKILKKASVSVFKSNFVKLATIGICATVAVAGILGLEALFAIGCVFALALVAARIYDWYKNPSITTTYCKNLDYLLEQVVAYRDLSYEII